MEITVDIRIKNEGRYGEDAHEVNRHLALIHPDLDVDYNTTGREEMKGSTITSYLSGATEEALVSAILEYLFKTQNPAEKSEETKQA